MYQKRFKKRKKTIEICYPLTTHDSNIRSELNAGFCTVFQALQELYRAVGRSEN